MKFLSIFAALLLSICAFAQQAKDEATMEKEFREALDKEVERLTDLLQLEDWQVFYTDSILAANSYGRKDEMVDMSKRKVSNSDAYLQVNDKWMEKTYVAFQQIFTEEQWAKYNKTGALKEKKARDKRAAKLQGTAK